MLTDRGDSVLDPFAGSCVTGEVCERLERRWLCTELLDTYLNGAIGRFETPEGNLNGTKKKSAKRNYYKLPRVGLLWDKQTENKLTKNGGETRPTSKKVRKKKPPDNQ